MQNYGKLTSRRRTSQSKPIPGQSMEQNNAGGYAFAITSWHQLERFLILGSAAGTYYVNADVLTDQITSVLETCMKQDLARTVQLIKSVAVEGRAAKKEPAIFALAYMSARPDPEYRAAAFSILKSVCQIPTHLFQFCSFRKELTGWSSRSRRAIGDWYLDKPVNQLVYHMMKYEQREGWSNRDILRLTHPKPRTTEQNFVFRYVTKGTTDEVVRKTFDQEHVGEVARPIAVLRAFDWLKNNTPPVKTAVKMITEHKFTHDMLPKELLAEPIIWSTLLPHMPITALIRNLGNLSKHGLLTERSAGEQHVIRMLTDESTIVKGRVHPLNVLVALLTYVSGHGLRGRGTWTVNQRVADVLNTTYELSFKCVEPMNKRLIIGIDVSGSMSGPPLAGTMIVPRQGAAALAQLWNRTEPDVVIRGFTADFVDLKFRKSDSFDQVVRKCNRHDFGGTDCALPILYAIENKIPTDVFMVITDNETWAGQIHPVQALQAYRRQFNQSAKLIVIGMAATQFSIADPNDPGMLDVVGFDTNLPAAIKSWVESSEK